MLEFDESSIVNIPVSDNPSLSAPITPTNIQVSVNNGLASLSWVNGTEADLIGTIIRFSPIETGTYSQVANLKGNNQYNHFIGENKLGYFSLANYNQSSLFSSYSTGVSGVAGINSSLNSPVLYSTDSSPEYYLRVTPYTLPLYTDNLGNLIDISTYNVIVPRNGFMTPILKPNSVSGVLGSWATFYSSGYSGVCSIYATDLGQPVQILSTLLSGVSGVVSMSTYDSNTKTDFNIVYQSGARNNLYWNNYVYESNGKFAEHFSSSGVIGNLIGNPVLASNVSFQGNQIIAFVTGTNNLGFVAINQSGLQTGNVFYDNSPGKNINTAYQFDGCMDNNGYVHLFWQSSPDINTTQINWFKYLYENNKNGYDNAVYDVSTYDTPNNTYSNLLFVNSGTFFLSQGQDKIWGNVRCFCDKRNEISLFVENQSKDTYDFGGTTQWYAKLDINGNIVYNISPYYTVPFNYDYFNVSYNPQADNVYMNYYLKFQEVNKNINLPGMHRKRGVFKALNSGNDFSQFQSISK